MAIQEHIFWGHVQGTADCWIWNGPERKGYGRYSRADAHRVAYELAIGPIPQGLEIDHLCRTPLCVRPEHLEPVTRLENMRRRYADQHSCHRGHEFTPENTYTGAGRRQCRTCQREAVRKYKARKQAAS